MHRALKDAVSWGYLLRNPAAMAVKPKQPSTGSIQLRAWGAADVRRFLDHVREDRLFALWRLAVATGMRRGELVGLRWMDVDLEAGRVAVRQPITTAGRHVVFGEPKTARGKRNVALEEETVASVRAWRIRQTMERLAFGPA